MQFQSLIRFVNKEQRQCVVSACSRGSYLQHYGMVVLAASRWPLTVGPGSVPGDMYSWWTWWL